METELLTLREAMELAIEKGGDVMVLDTERNGFYVSKDACIKRTKSEPPWEDVCIQIGKGGLCVVAGEIQKEYTQEEMQKHSERFTENAFGKHWHIEEPRRREE